MIKEEFYFDSRDGENRIHAVRYTPDDGNVRGIVQIVHGMAEYVERYENLAEFLTKRGILVTGEDHLGHGKSVSEGGSFGYFCEQDPATVVVRDVHRLKKITEEQYPQVPYIILGHSMGSYMLRKYLCIHPEGVAGAVIMGTGAMPDSTMKFGLFLCRTIALFRGWHYRSRLMQSLSYSKPYKRYDLYGKDYANSWLSKNVENVKTYYADPRCTFLFTVNGYKGLMEAVLFDDQMENIKKVPKNLPLFFVSGADDPVGDLGEGVKKVYQKFLQAGMKDVSCKLYKNDRHEILNETDREQVYADLLGWMKKRIK